MDAFLKVLPRQKFSKDARFQNQMVKRSPGPIYNPKRSVNELKGKDPPKWGWGQPGKKSRADFIHGELSKDGYLYNTSPSTMEGDIDISPAQYKISEKSTRPTLHDQSFGKANRFQSVSIGKKRAQGRYGHESPGPIYNPVGETIGHTRGEGNNATPTGKWCP
jgi:hypothetical protein